jgi:hypothetical protein
MTALSSRRRSATRTSTAKSLTWRMVWTWYAAAFALCVVGALSHDLLFTSEIWNKWAATRYTAGSVHLLPVWADIGRAAVGFMLSFWGLQWLDVVSERDERSIGNVGFAPHELVITSVAVTVALFFAYYVLPANFYFECRSLVAAGVIGRSVTFTSDEIWKSYVLYSPYVLGLWLGMVYPVFFFFISSIRTDYVVWKSSGETARTLTGRITKKNIDLVWTSWLARHHVLKQVAAHYVPVLTFVLLLVIFEKVFFHVSATQTGDHSGLAALSLMLLPALIISTILFTRQYATEREQTEIWLEKVAKKSSDLHVRSEAHQKLRDLENFSDLKFFFGVVASRGYTLVVCFAVANLALGSLVPNIWQSLKSP